MAKPPPLDMPRLSADLSPNASFPPNSPPGDVSAEGAIHQSLRRAKDSVENLSHRAHRASPDGGASLGRAGRQFTVGNIGNNGLIYLRPVVRPGTDRSWPSLSPFLYAPVTPPDTGDLDSNLRPAPSSNGHESQFSSAFTPPGTAPKQLDRASHDVQRTLAQPPSRSGTHVRAHSFSTVEESHQRPSLDHPGTFKVVIHRPSVKRPKANQPGYQPQLQVMIPHYRLGSPHFASTGSAILRSSVYTRSSAAREEQGMLLHSSYISGRTSDARPPPLFYRRSRVEPQSQHLPVPGQSSVRESYVSIGPAIFDPFALQPNDPTVVRYAPGTKEITAATPARLIAHITSHNFLDYELLSDFFLTFRAFIQPQDLVSYLMARLRWAVDRADDSGRIARVRTFVALRHWILNYFVDDFVPDFSLRQHFCDSVNRLYGDLGGRADGGGGDLKIVGELKKCWRRTCALYWDDVEVPGNDAPSDNILPGGQMGSRSSSESGATTTPPATGPARFNVQPPSPPTMDFPNAPSHTTKPSSSNRGEAQKKGQHGVRQSLTSAPYSFPPSSQVEQQAPLSPASEQSMHVLSCSIPVKPVYQSEPSAQIPLVPHPIQASSAAISATSASATAPFPGRHQRSGSFSDAMHDDRGPLSMVEEASEENLPAMLVIPGWLVRGALYQPADPYFDIKPLATIKPAKSKSDMSGSDSHGAAMDRQHTASNPGMRKLLGSVRRALSSRQMADNSPPSSISDSSLPGQSTKELRSPPTSEPVAGALPQKRSAGRVRTQVRIDILAARTLESFKDAVAQIESEQEQEQREARERDNGTPTPRFTNSRFTRSVTIGSRSIVIVDDTHPDLPTMSGALRPTSHGTISLYENYVAGATKDSRDLLKQPTNRATNVSIDSILASQTRATPPAAQPQTYVPVGLLPGSLNGDGKIALSPDVNRQRFTNSMRSERSQPSSLRRYASYHGGVTPTPTDQDTGPETDPDQFDNSTRRSSETDPFVLDKPPARQLRRRPGGNLRAVSKVHDLEPQRPHSAGTLSNASQSLAGSFALPSKPGSMLHSSPSKIRGTQDDMALPGRKSISLIQTHSSQPNLRPSFEAEVAKLAALPDDDDDGGIESALLKLEGRYEKRSPSRSPVKEEFVNSLQGNQDWQLGENADDRKQRHHHNHVEDIHPVQHIQIAPLSPKGVQSRSIRKPSRTSRGGTIRTHAQKPSHSTRSEESYSSIPLLERGLSDVGKKSKKLGSTAARDSDGEGSERGKPPRNVRSPDSSIEHVEETDSMRRIPKGETMPRSPTIHESFLLDDNQDLSDNSASDMSDVGRSESESQGVRSFFDDEAVEDESDTEMFTHPLRHPDTPPAHVSPAVTPRPAQDGGTMFNQGLPTPGLAPTAKSGVAAVSTPSPPPGVQPVALAAEGKRPTKPADREYTAPGAHLPFILAYDAEALAQQFTLIEKDALDEIDWRELVELRWKQSSPSVRDWVEYLVTQDARGVDLVIARFNLVVKWVKSEMVLCDNLDERVRCATQYIHIAEHCRRMHNYATMYQITIALLSSDCARLKGTWEEVPDTETEILNELEKLVQPLKNFHDLRAEMETGAGDAGCIPFIGIYTRDLVYNAQKPAFVTTPPYNADDPLVNFERHHTAATIVKSLLRLLEASSNYTFQIDPIVASRCLWLGTLSDDEITARSKRLE